MDGVLLTLELLVLFFVILLLYNRYADIRRVHFTYTISVILGWFLSFSVIILVPFDLAQTFNERCVAETCHTSILMSKDNLILFWKLLYWASFFLCWLIIPLQQSYSTAGDFTFLQRCKTSLRENGIFYLITGVVFTCFIIYIAIKKHLGGNEIVGFAMALANCWGLLLLVAMLGHGLVDVPKKLWLHASAELTLRRLQFFAMARMEALEQARMDLKETLRDVMTVADAVSFHDPLRSYVDIIVTKAPLSEDDTDTMARGELPKEVNMKFLTKLHKQLLLATANVTKEECLYQAMLDHAFSLEDIIENEDEHSRVFRSSLRSARSHKSIDKLEWYWKLWVRPFLLRVVAVVAVVISLVILWSQLTAPFGSSPDLSIISQLLHIHGLSDTQLQIVCLIFLSFTCLCAYGALFQFHIFDYYKLVPHKHTDANSLLFSAAYALRLAIPLCYNFFLVVHEGDDTAFADVIGLMDLVPVLGEDFYVYFPLLLLLLCFLNITHAYGKLAKLLRVDQLAFDELEDLAIASEGMALLDKERQKRERMFRSKLRQELVNVRVLDDVSGEPVVGSLPPSQNKASGRRVSGLFAPAKGIEDFDAQD
eukprot:GCRY01003414.1.p1 GENE.GCRY01003414.1~~GCRY01003414.1.p1  ORF type:complete len:595 (+),score=155.52 GCRY01003414.1:176-1960(+)